MKIERVQPTQKINEKLSKKKEEPKPRKKYESGDTFEKSPELQKLLKRAQEE